MRVRNVIALCAACFLGGLALSWAYVRTHLVHLPPVDRSLYQYVAIDPGCPLLCVAMDRTNALCWPFGSANQAQMDLGRLLRSKGRLDPEGIFPVAVDIDVPIAQVEALMRTAEACNVHGFRVLVPHGASGNGPTNTPLFREIRIGPARTLHDQHYEWYLEWKQAQVQRPVPD